MRHLSLEGGRGQERFSTYLFNMNEVFERFVGRYLQEHFLHDKTTEVALQYPIWLDAERQEKGIPDIVIRRTDGTTTVLDTKYKFFKGNPDPRDRDQMWIYSQRIKAREGILIYPDSQTLLYQTTFEGVPLRAVALPLDSDLATFRERCRQFATQLTQYDALSAPDFE